MKYSNRLFFFALLAVIFLSACNGSKETTTSHASTERNFLYFDATANFKRFSYKDSVIYYLHKAKDAGVTDVVIDVKPITGEVLYPSKIAPVMVEWHGEYQSGEKDTSWDMLSLFIEEGHSIGLTVHASTNVFVAGHNFFDRGVVYDDPTKAHWQTISYLPTGMTPITAQKKKYSAMLNPALEEVQEYELAILEELVTMYPNLDGIVLDRVRYDGVEADFSDASRALFEAHIGKKVQNWPSDIFSWSKAEKPSRIDGPLFREWLVWRAKVIHDFIYEAKDVIKAANPDILFGDYTGSWYPTYYEVGVNWASKSYDPSLDFDWAAPEYKQYGYSDALDIFLTGNYYYEVNKREAEQIDTTKVVRTEAGQGLGKEHWYTVEGSAELVNRIVSDTSRVYAGIYVEQYKGDPEQFIKALRMCRAKSQGAMIFDIVHIVQNNWWDELKSGLLE